MRILNGGTEPMFPHIDGKAIPFPCYAEVKIDGEANVYGGGVMISKASGKMRTDFPATNVLSKILKGKEDTILFGELHWGDGKSGALYDFLSHAKDDDLNYTIFDVHNPTLINATYEDRREWLITNILQNDEFKRQAKYDVQGCLNDIGKVRITRPILLEDKADLDQMIEENKKDGWEGIVLKAPNSILYSQCLIVGQTRWVKIKHRYTGDYQVDSISTTQERMEVLVPVPPGNSVFRKCGVKLVNKYKPYVSVGDVVEIEHMGVLSSGGLRHPVFSGKVVTPR